MIERSHRRWRRVSAALVPVSAALICLLPGCGMLDPAPFPKPAPVLEPGARQWIITVENMSRKPANLFVAEDLGQMGQSVGIADPSMVPAGATQDVVFSVPPGQGWAIFVNPGPKMGPLILAQDVPPEAAGSLPIRIGIGPDGSPYSSMQRQLPGWFGN